MRSNSVWRGRRFGNLRREGLGRRLEACLASLFFRWITVHLLDNNRIYAIIAGGVFMLIAAGLMQRVKDPRTLSVEDA
jgi:hypothetical protein